MPRDLSQLMENAVSTPPHEPHLAGDITRLAQRHQRRRTTFVAAASSLAVAVVAGVAIGHTNGHPTQPEPAARFKHGQTVDLSDAVPASSLPGYQLEPWTVTSVQHFATGQVAPTYQDVDEDGRLIVVDIPGGDPQQGPFRVHLYDSPGSSGRLLQPPTAAGTGTWIPRFYGADQLI